MDNDFTIGLGTMNDEQTIIGLIEKAALWLRGKDTDQWAVPWPDKKARDRRVRSGLELGQTWIVQDGRVPVATMTVCPRPNPDVWRDVRDDAAVYIHRLVVDRAYAGLDLGGTMIDWAVQREFDSRTVDWVRVDVWTRNKALHAYYERQGFVRCGECPDPEYPSGALFQKAADGALKTDTSRLVEVTSPYLKH
jgi:ribosomal protein S18 acetylase RimI-like enzyme